MTSARPARPGLSEAPPKKQSAYETDFYAWTQEQAAALRTTRATGLDIPNLVEEIDSLGRAQINALESRYFQLCVHLLKLVHQPQKSSRSWLGTVGHQRFEIAQLLEDSPSLGSKRGALFARAYKKARRQLSIETGLAMETFPAEPSFSIEEAEADDWFPAPMKA